MDGLFPKKYLLVDWIFNNSRAILRYTVLTVFLLFASVYFYTKYKGKADLAYLSSVQHLKEMGQTEDMQKIHAHLEKLGLLIDKHPTMHAAFDAAIAGELLIHGEVEKAKPFAQLAFDRAGKTTPLHTRFGQISLMIGEGDFSDALEETMILQGELDEFAASGPAGLFHANCAALYANNLLRIAFLEKESGDFQNELAAWNLYKNRSIEFENYLKNEASEGNPFTVLESNFKKENLSLDDYIAYRRAIGSLSHE